MAVAVSVFEWRTCLDIDGDSGEGMRVTQGHEKRDHRTYILELHA